MRCIVFLVCLMTTLVGADNADEICLSIRREPSHSQEVAQGPPGRRGPIGPPGPKGARGPIGTCTCSLNEIKDEVSRLNEKTKALKSTFQTDRCYGGLVYDNKCIRLAYVRGGAVNFNDARDICDGSLADITSDEMFDVVYDYVRRTWLQNTDHPSRDFVELWLGLAYQLKHHPTKDVTLMNGNTTTLDRWHNGYPSASAGYMRMGCRVNYYNRNQPMGLFNYRENWAGGVPLCQFVL
ncbi:unnamed protein product [Clavelina lepadiformis]|uniref:C-type lectin domain-containing protein n=1 Tax=Clavelina lepadiformis TaxID=159417 RepID=A0ABP0F7X2_CLALP